MIPSLGLARRLLAAVLCLIAAGGCGYTGTASATRFEIVRSVTADCTGTQLTIAWRLDAAR